jgi:uncharacterized membrane protein
VVRNDEPDYVIYLDQAFEDLRERSEDPLTLRALLDVLDDLTDAAVAVGKPERASFLRRHADLVVEQARRQDHPEADERWVVQRADRISASA